MRKILGYVLCLLLIGFTAYAGMSTLFFRGTSAGEDYSDITFWWRAEDSASPTLLNGDCTGSGAPYSCCSGADAGTCDYTAGSDTSGTFTSSAAINTSAVKIGVRGLDIPSSSDHVDFDDPSDAAWDSSSFRLGFYLYLNSVDTLDNKMLARKQGDASNYIYVRFDGNDDIEVYYRDDSNIRTAYTTTNFLAISTWYYIEISVDVSTTTIDIYCNGSSQTTTESGTMTATLAGGNLEFGEVGVGAVDYYMDQIIISDDYQRDLNALKDLTEYPG